MNKLALLILFVVACDGCGPRPLPPLPIGSSEPPAPIVSDARPTCESACGEAVASCPRPSMSAEKCTSRCTEGMRQLTDACPRGLAAVLACNGKSVCP